MKKSYLFRYVSKIINKTLEEVEYVVLSGQESLEQAIKEFNEMGFKNFGYNVYFVDNVPCFSTDEYLQKQIEDLNL